MRMNEPVGRTGERPRKSIGGYRSGVLPRP
nr:MAG TPA: hypothetical protein [Caudoviricetes sp.]